jgi:GNAT superfamily N-acetyltransferase
LDSWVAEVDDQVIGHVSLDRSDEHAGAAFWTAATGLEAEGLGVVSRLMAHPDHRRLHVASRLIDCVLRRCDELSLWPALEVATADFKAIGFYDALGWRLVGTQPADERNQIAVHAYVWKQQASS